MKCKNQSLFGFLVLLTCSLIVKNASATEHCSINSTSMTFPPYDMFMSAPVNAQADLTVLCEQGLPFVVKISPGLNSSGDFSRRNMLAAEGVNNLFYNLYLDSGYARIWGDGTGFSEFYTGVGQARPELIRVFGRIPPSQNVRSGAYFDSVVISIEW